MVGIFYPFWVYQKIGIHTDDLDSIRLRFGFLNNSNAGQNKVLVAKLTHVTAAKTIDFRDTT